MSLGAEAMHSRTGPQTLAALLGGAGAFKRQGLLREVQLLGPLLKEISGELCPYLPLSPLAIMK